MHDTIPHGTHEIPWDFGILFFDFLGNLAGRFPNDDEIHFDGTDGAVIFAEGFKVRAKCKSLDFGNRIQDIANTFPSVPR